MEQRIRFPRALATPSIHLSRLNYALTLRTHAVVDTSHTLSRRTHVSLCVCVGGCVC